MRWDGSPTAGFTTATPWLPIGPGVGEINVEAERHDPESMLSLYRRLLALRRAAAALNVGAWVDLDHTPSTLAFLRTDGDRRFLIALNFSGRAAPLPDAAQALRGRLLVSTLSAHETDFDGSRSLAPNEAVVVRLH